MKNINISKTCQINNLTDIYRLYLDNIKDGFFIEVGAFDGESYSNTSGLADIGWNGIYIEPVEKFAKLCQDRHKNNNVKIINSAIVSSFSTHEVEINVGDALSTLLSSHVDLYNKLPWANNIKFEKAKVHAQRLDKILIDNNVKQGFDLLVVDVGGMECDVFNSFGLKYWLPKMLIVELIDNNQEFSSLQDSIVSCKKLKNEIINSGYTIVYSDSINTIFVHNSNKIFNSKKGELNLNLIPKLLNKQNPVILDIGTNNGSHTKLFFELFPLGNIHSFEPDPRAIQKFKLNLANYPRAKLHEIAIGAEDGFAEFYASGGQNLALDYRMESGWDMSGSLRRPTGHLQEHPGITFDNKFKVITTKLDTWRINNNIDYIDFVWADVQGAEVDLINGGIYTFTHHVKYLYTEYSNKELYEGQINLQQLLNLLPTYSIVNLFEFDVLLVNNNLL